MTNKRNPYRPLLRNVHVRRIFIITVQLLWIIVFIPIVAFKSVCEELKNEVPDLIRAFKDGNSYD
jgi:hypothetical protein